MGLINRYGIFWGTHSYTSDGILQKLHAINNTNIRGVCHISLRCFIGYCIILHQRIYSCVEGGYRNCVHSNATLIWHIHDLTVAYEYGWNDLVESNQIRDSIRHIRNNNTVMTWRLFPYNWSFVGKINRSSVDYPHKGPVFRALMFSFVFAWTNCSTKLAFLVIWDEITPVLRHCMLVSLGTETENNSNDTLYRNYIY